MEEAVAARIAGASSAVRNRKALELHMHAPPRKISIFGREMTMPQSRPLRVALGVVLVIFGIFGFLPILGFWMVPLGLLVLSYEFAVVRRWRRRSVVWWHRRKQKN